MRIHSKAILGFMLCSILCGCAKSVPPGGTPPLDRASAPTADPKYPCGLSGAFIAEQGGKAMFIALDREKKRYLSSLSEFSHYGSYLEEEKAVTLYPLREQCHWVDGEPYFVQNVSKGLRFRCDGDDGAVVMESVQMGETRVLGRVSVTNLEIESESCDGFRLIDDRKGLILSRDKAAYLLENGDLHSLSYRRHTDTRVELYGQYKGREISRILPLTEGEQSRCISFDSVLSDMVDTCPPREASKAQFIEFLKGIDAIAPDQRFTLICKAMSVDNYGIFDGRLSGILDAVTQIPESQLVSALHHGLSQDVTGRPLNEKSIQDYIDGIHQEGVSLKDGSAVPPHQLLLALYILRTTDPKHRDDPLFRLVVETLLQNQVNWKEP